MVDKNVERFEHELHAASFDKLRALAQRGHDVGVLDVARNVAALVAGGDDDVFDVHFQRRRERLFNGGGERVVRIGPDNAVLVGDQLGLFGAARLEEESRLGHAALVNGGARPVKVEMQPAQLLHGLKAALGGFKVARIGVALEPAGVSGKRKHRKIPSSLYSMACPKRAYTEKDVLSRLLFQPSDGLGEPPFAGGTSEAQS